MQANLYMERVVAPAFARYDAERSDLSLIYSVVVLMYHAADHVAQERGCRPGSVISEMANRYADFVILQALANAQKHGVFDRGKSHPHRFMKADDLEILAGVPYPVPFIVGAEAQLKLPDGSLKPLHPIIEGAFRFLQTFLK